MTTERYTIAESRGSGKAVKGKQKTSTIQVRDYTAFANGDYMLMAQFRYVPSKDGDRERAIAKARTWVQQHANEVCTC